MLNRTPFVISGRQFFKRIHRNIIQTADDNLRTKSIFSRHFRKLHFLLSSGVHELLFKVHLVGED